VDQWISSWCFLTLNQGEYLVTLPLRLLQLPNEMLRNCRKLVILSTEKADNRQERYTGRESGSLHSLRGPDPHPLEVQTQSPVLDTYEVICDLSSKFLFLLRPG